MFTGIIEERGAVTAVETYGDAARLRIQAPAVAADAGPGDSIAVNGVCLTVVEPIAGEFGADVMQESLARSSLGALQPGSLVNLERPLTLASRLGGHLVQGHVDGRAEIVERHPGAGSELIRFSLPGGLDRYLVEKGSIAVDGVSLTVVDVGDGSFSVSLVATTLERTTLGAARPGDPVNLEVDVVAKYVEKLLEGRT